MHECVTFNGLSLADSLNLIRRIEEIVGKLVQNFKQREEISGV